MSSMTAHLKVQDITATFRGDDPTRDILVGHDGTRLILAVDMARANELASIITRGDTTQSEEWLRATVDIITASEVSGGGR